MEHRCGYRRAVNVSVTLRTQEGLMGTAILCEVSASGARLATSLPLSVHSIVCVQFAVRRPSGPPKRETLEAEVVRSTPTGFAVEWTEFAPEAARAFYAPLLNADSDTLTQIPPERRRGRR
jgi:hypothetical protein